jgi:hypothetical protein
MTDPEILDAAKRYREMHMLTLVLAGSARVKVQDVSMACDLAEAELVRLLREAAGIAPTYRGKPLADCTDDDIMAAYAVTKIDMRPGNAFNAVMAEIERRRLNR